MSKQSAKIGWLADEAQSHIVRGNRPQWMVDALERSLELFNESMLGTPRQSKPKENRPKHASVGSALLVLLDQAPEDVLRVGTLQRNALQYIPTMRELVLTSQDEMLRYRNFGLKSLRMVESELARFGLYFGMTEQELAARLVQ